MEPVISQKDRCFRGQGPDEYVLAFCRRHAVSLVFHVCIFFLVTVGLILFVIYYPLLEGLFELDFFRFMLFFTGIMLLYYMHHFFLRLFRHYLSVIIVTNTRVISLTKSLYLINEKEAVDLKNIQEVRKMQSGVLQNLFSFGDLYIILSTSTQGVYLHDIPNPDFHFRLINKAKQAYLKDHQPGSAGAMTGAGITLGTEPLPDTGGSRGSLGNSLRPTPLAGKILW